MALAWPQPFVRFAKEIHDQETTVIIVVKNPWWHLLAVANQIQDRGFEKDVPLGI